MPTLLDYAFTPSLMYASVSGGNPSIVSIQVQIDYSGGLSLSVSAIKITIPTGANSAGDLSSASMLPSPEYEDPDVWDIKPGADSTILITPTPGQSGKMGTDAIVFTLPNITVNEQPGPVQISIEEYLSTGTYSDNSTYKLDKQPSGSPVTKFYAVPSSLSDRDLPVTVYWDTSDSDEFVYDLYTEDWHPRDCINQDNCYSAADGQTGVTTPNLQQSTVFHLDIIQAVSGGSRTSLYTLDLPVNMNVPELLSPVTASTSLIYSGQIVTFHWIAQNATSVSVLVDGVTYDDNAPLDTYQNGYPVPISETTNPTATVSIIAYNKTVASTPQQFIISIQPPARIDLTPLDQYYFLIYSLLRAPNNPLVLAVSTTGGSVLGVNYQTQAMSPLLGLEMGEIATCAITPDGRYALFSSFGSSDTFVLNVANWALESDKTIIIPNDLITALAAHPSGTTMWGALASGSIIALDLQSWTYTTQIQQSGLRFGSIAFTPDGHYLLAKASTNLLIYDLTNMGTAPFQVPIAAASYNVIAITSDNRLAFVTAGTQITIVDLTTPSFSIYDIISNLDGTPMGIALSADHQRALISLGLGVGVAILYDIPNRAILKTISLTPPEYFYGFTAAVITEDFIGLLIGTYTSSPSTFMLMFGAYDLPPLSLIHP